MSSRPRLSISDLFRLWTDLVSGSRDRAVDFVDGAAFDRERQGASMLKKGSDPLRPSDFRWFIEGLQRVRPEWHCREIVCAQSGL